MKTKELNLFETFFESALYLWIHLVFLFFVCVFVKVEDTRLILWCMFVLIYVFNSGFVFRVKRFFYLLKRVIYVLYRKHIKQRIIHINGIFGIKEKDRSFFDRNKNNLSISQQIVFLETTKRFMKANDIRNEDKFIDMTYSYLLESPYFLSDRHKLLTKIELSSLIIFIMKILIKK